MAGGKPRACDVSKPEKSRSPEGQSGPPCPVLQEESNQKAGKCLLTQEHRGNADLLRSINRAGVSGGKGMEAVDRA